jgi:hypothetical protein
VFVVLGVFAIVLIAQLAWSRPAGSPALTEPAQIAYRLGTCLRQARL